MIVHVYSQPACQACRLTKKRLFDLGVEFLDFDISIDDKAYEFVVDGLDAKEAPVVVQFSEPDYTLPMDEWSMEIIDYWTGFRPENISALLDTERTKETA